MPGPKTPQPSDASSKEEASVRKRRRKPLWLTGGIAAVVVAAVIGSSVLFSLASSSHRTPSSGDSNVQSLTVSGSPTASLNRDSSTFKLDAARSVLLTAKDSSKSLYILNPITTTRGPAKAAIAVLGASASTFKVDKKACLPLLLAGSSTASFTGDPEPHATIYLMQDNQDSDDGPDIAASQSARTFESARQAMDYTNKVSESLDDCDEVITQTSQSATPVSQEFSSVATQGAKYVDSAYLASVTDYSDATATAVLRKGNLVTCVTVQTSTASHSRLTKALAKAIGIIDAKLDAI